MIAISIDSFLILLSFKASVTTFLVRCGKGVNSRRISSKEMYSAPLPADRAGLVFREPITKRNFSTELVLVVAVRWTRNEVHRSFAALRMTRKRPGQRSGSTQTKMPGQRP